jgi:hypothetical protein
MSLQKRTLAALSGVLMAFLIALGGIPAAQASNSAPDGTRGTTIAADGQGLRAAQSVGTDAGTLANPGVSPAPERTVTFETATQAIRLVNDCPAGRFCAYQKLDNGQFRTYYFYECADYQLSNWDESRWAANHQTGGVTVRLLGSRGQLVSTVRHGEEKTVDWDPIWTIRLCG